jgi:hypothetical protein
MNRNVLAVLLAATALAGADTGEFLLDREVAYATAESDQLYPAAASNGTNSLVIWSDGRSGPTDIYGARFAPDGTVLDPAGIVISTAANGQTSPAVASDGANYLVAWADQRGDTSDIYVSRVTSVGLVLDPAGIPVSLAAGFQGEPAVTFDGTNYLVVWTDERGDDADIYGARVTPGGTVVDTSGIPLVAVPAYQSAPAVAYDGTDVLLVWADTRNDVLGDIYAARVTSEGAVLDSAGFAISAASNLQGSPGIAFGRDEALVVWQDMRGGIDVDVYGSRITSAGEVLDPSGVEISAIANNQWFPKVAFDGTNYLVVWVDAAGHANIFGGRVGTDGSLLDPQGFMISLDGEYEASPAVAFNGTHNVVAWYDLHPGAGGYDIYAARVNGEGVLLDPRSIALSTSAIPQRRPKAASGEAEFLVVWDEIRDRSRGIHGVRLTPEGGVFDTLGIRVSPVGGDQSVPAVAHGMTDFLVVWEEGRLRDRDVRGARVRADGAVMDPTGILISGASWEQCTPEVASDGADFLVVWQDWRNSDYDIYCARVSHSGTLLDTAGIAVCTADGWQASPAVACNGTDYLVLWQSMTTGGYDLYGARISPQGVVRDPDGFVISAAPGTQQHPAAASDGTDFLVVWSDSRDVDCNVYAARVTGAGTVLDTAGIPLFSAAGPQYAPAVEYDGAKFLVVWQDQRGGEQDIYGARVTPQGSVLDTFAVTTMQGDEFDPALARGPGNGILTAYSSWAGDVEEESYNSLRIWGTLSPHAGTNDRPTDVARTPRPAPTFVRGVLVLGAADSRQNTEYRAELLDVGGRKVLDLLPGPNDVRALAPGVYFVRNAQPQAQAQAQAVRKVVITR